MQSRTHFKTLAKSLSTTTIGGMKNALAVLVLTLFAVLLFVQYFFEIDSSSISRKEEEVLVRNYYFKKGIYLKLNRNRLKEIFLKSSDAALDGGACEIQTSRLVVALAYAGDDLYSSVLEECSLSVRQSVFRRIDNYINNPELSYPNTVKLDVKHGNNKLGFYATECYSVLLYFTLRRFCIPSMHEEEW